MTEPSITIALLTFNRPDLLKQAINSCAHQSVRPTEILVIDDGSGAETRSLVEQLQQSSPHLRYVWQENAGRPTARNRAFAECKTSHLMWLDDDDILLPTAVESHLRCLKRHPDADVVYGNLMLCDRKMDPVRRLPKFKLDGPDILYQFFLRDPVPNPSTVISVSCFQKAGPYQLRFKRAQDYDFYARAASLKCRFVHNDNTVCLYRSHADNSATPEKIKKVAHYDAWVVQDMISRHLIEEIFSHYPWEQQPQLSLFRACVEIAQRLCMSGAFREACEVLEQVQLAEFDEVTKALLAVIQRGSNDGIDGLLSLRTHPLYLTPIVEQMLNAMVEFLGTEAQKDSFRATILRHRLNTQKIEAIYPALPWQADRGRAMAHAVVDLCSKFISFGDFGSAVATLEQFVAGDSQPIVRFIEEVLVGFQRGGLGAVVALDQNPMYQHPVIQAIVNALRYRTHRLKETQALGN